MLSLAWAIAQLGWVIGPSVMIFFSLITWYTSSLLAECYRIGDPHYGKRNYTFMEAVHTILGKSFYTFMLRLCFQNQIGLLNYEAILFMTLFDILFRF